MSRTIAEPVVEIAWDTQLTGVFTLDMSQLDGTDVLPGTWGNNAFDDLTDLVRSIEVHRGRSGALAGMEQGTCTLIVRDLDGTYNPESPTSPLAGLITDMRPVRIRAQWARYIGAVLADEPLGYWRLGETSGSTAADSGPLGTDGSYAGAVTHVAGALAGDTDGALGLPGAATAYMQVPRTGYLDVGVGSFTVECWFKATANGILVDKYAGGAVGYQLYLSAGKIATWDGASHVAASGSLLDNAWHHVVWSCSRGGNSVVYVDGVAVLTYAAVATNLTNAADIYLGHQQVTGTFILTGTIDEVALYDTALSAARVLTHYQIGVGTLAGDTYGLFYGFVSDIEHNPAPTGRVTTIKAVDFFEWLAGVKPEIASTGATTVGAAIGLILDAAEWTDASMRALDAGDDIPDFSADGTKSGLQLITDLLQTDLGIVFVDGDGVVTYFERNRLYADQAVVDTFGAGSLLSARPSISTRNVVNRQKVTRTGGVEQEATNEDSRKQRGWRDGSPITSAYLNDDAQALNLAEWKVLVQGEGDVPTRGILLANRDDTQIVRQLTRELGDYVAVAEPTGGTDTEGTIVGLGHRWDAGTRAHFTTLTVLRKPAVVFTLDVSELDSAAALGY